MLNIIDVPEDEEQIASKNGVITQKQVDTNKHLKKQISEKEKEEAELNRRLESLSTS